MEGWSDLAQYLKWENVEESRVRPEPRAPMARDGAWRRWSRSLRALTRADAER